jgi:hypothetical protein
MKYEVLEVRGCSFLLLNVYTNDSHWETISHLDLRRNDIVQDIHGRFYKI